MTRTLGFHWKLRQLMAAHNIWKTTDLIPLLAERGVKLSTAQVYRLVTDKPERLSMRTLVALCDILSCTPSDLITPYVETRARRTSGSAAGASAEPSPGQAPVGRGRSTVPAGPRTDHRRRRLTLPPDPLPLTPAEPMT